MTLRTATAHTRAPSAASWSGRCLAAAWSCRLLLPLLALLGACATTPQPAVLSANDQIALAQASTYLNNLQKFRADFTQAGRKGIEKGVVWLDRPGRLRVEYSYPGPETIVANNGRLLIANQSTGATTTMPVSRTPLDILLRQTIPLSGPVTVTALHRTPGVLSLTLVKTEAPNQGTLTLLFNANPLKLRGLIITDRLGRETRLALWHIERDPGFAPDLFTAQAVQQAAAPAS